MSLKVEDMDMEKLSDDEKQYLRDRPWLPQPPGDPVPHRAESDWNEDDVEQVPLDAFGKPLEEEDDDHVAGEGPVDDDGEPIKVDGDGNTIGFDWERMTKPRLKEYLEAYDLPVSGRKDEMVARLEEYDVLSAENPDG